MSDWQIGLITGAAALGGAAIGSMTQLALARAGTNERTAREQAEQRCAVYESFLNLVIGLPELMRSGVVASATAPAGTESVLGPFRAEFGRLRVLLLLEASPEVQAGVENLRRAFTSALENEWPVRLEAEASTIGVYAVFDALFEKFIWPEAESLGEVMARELGAAPPKPESPRRWGLLPSR